MKKEDILAFMKKNNFLAAVIVDKKTHLVYNVLSDDLDRPRLSQLYIRLVMMQQDILAKYSKDDFVYEITDKKGNKNE